MSFSNPCFIDWNGGYTDPTTGFFSLTLIHQSGETAVQTLHEEEELYFFSHLQWATLFREGMLQSSTPARLTRLICTPSLNHPLLPSALHPGRVAPRWRNACWVRCLSCRGCLDTPSENMLWATSSRESAWGSCSYRRVSLIRKGFSYPVIRFPSWKSDHWPLLNLTHWIVTKVMAFVLPRLCRNGLRLAGIGPSRLWPLLLLLPSSHLLHLRHIQAHLHWFGLVLQHFFFNNPK